MRLHKKFDSISLSMGKHKPTKQLFGLINTEVILFLKDLFIKNRIRTVVTVTTVLVRFFMNKSLQSLSLRTDYWLCSQRIYDMSGHVSFSLDHIVWHFFLKWYFVTKILNTHREIQTLERTLACLYPRFAFCFWIPPKGTIYNADVYPVLT